MSQPRGGAFWGRVVVFLCTNRLSVLHAALQRRAAVIEEFTRLGNAERREQSTSMPGAIAASPGSMHIYFCEPRRAPSPLTSKSSSFVMFSTAPLLAEE